MGSKFEKEVNKAIAWLATEHNFFKEMKNDLKELDESAKKALKLSESVTGIKKVFRDANNFWRAEKRLNKYVKEAESLLEGLENKVNLPKKREEAEKLIQRLDVEAAHLALDASRYTGRIRKLLAHLNSLIKDKELEQAHQIIMEILEIIGEADKWLTALSSDLDKAKDLAYKFSEVYHINSGAQLLEVLSDFPDKAKITYLTNLLKHSKSFKRNLRREIINQLYDLVAKVGYVAIFKIGELLEEEGYAYEAAEFYEKMYFASKESINLPRAARCYSNIRMFEKAAKLYEQNGNNLKAVQEYEKAKMFEKAAQLSLKHWKKELLGARINFNDFSHIYLRYRDYYVAFIAGYKKTTELFILAGDMQSAKRVAEIYVRVILIIKNKSLHRLRLLVKLLERVGYSKIDANSFIGDHTRPELKKDKARAYEKANRWEDAGKIWTELGNSKFANRALKKAGKQKKRKTKQKKPKTKEEKLLVEAEIASSQGNHSKAAEPFEKIGQFEKAFDEYKNAGDGPNAMRLKKMAGIGGLSLSAGQGGELSNADDNEGRLSLSKKKIRKKVRQ